MLAVNTLKLLKEENRQITYFFPAVSFGYIYAKGYTGVCNLTTQVGSWSYTGIPNIGYLFFAVVSIVTGIIVFRYSNLSTGSSQVVNSSTGYVVLTVHAALDFGSLIALLLRFCLNDMVLWTLFFLTLLTWLVNVIGKAG